MPGVSFQSRAIGVGSQYPESLPAMARTKRGSGYNVPLHIIPEGGKGAQDATEGVPVFEGEESAWIFQDAESGS